MRITVFFHLYFPTLTSLYLLSLVLILYNWFIEYYLIYVFTSTLCVNIVHNSDLAYSYMYVVLVLS